MIGDRVDEGRVGLGVGVRDAMARTWKIESDKLGVDDGA
jgi:hypothetical protein